MTIQFILSQVFQFIAYVILVFTMLRKTKEDIMWLLIVFNILMVASFVFLGNSESGMIVSALMAVKCLVEYLISKGIIGKKTLTIVDVFAYIGIVVTSIYAYDGFGSLLSVFGTALFLVSAKMKSVLSLKIFMFLSTVCWLLYQIYVKSPVGIGWECVVTTSSIVGVLTEFRREKQAKQA